MSGKAEANVPLWSKVLTSVGLTLIGAWAIYFMGPKETKETTIADLLKRSQVSMAELNYREPMIGDPIGAKNDRVAPYVNKQVVWEGFFDKVERHERTDPKNAYSLTLSDRFTTLEPKQSPIADAMRARVRCSLGVEAAPLLETLNRGDWVVVTGTVAKPKELCGGTTSELTECRIIVAQRERDESLVVDPDSLTIRR